jgi:hypothetical protein
VIKEHHLVMARIRLILLAVLAVFAVGAVASATASASKGEFVNKEGKALVKNVFTATSGETKLQTVGGTSVTCTKDLVLGVLTSATGGEATVHFTSCSSSALPCKSVIPSGANPKEIIVLVALLTLKFSATQDVILDTILEPGTKKPGEIEFECSGLKIKVKGSFYSEPITINTGLKTLVPVTAGQKAGIQNTKTNEAGVEAKLETNIEGKGFEGSAQEGIETFHFLEEGRFV